MFIKYPLYKKSKSLLVLVHLEKSCEELHKIMKIHKFTKLVAALASVGLAGVVGAQTAQTSAISVNPDGLGEALIYPFYTVQNGNSTLLSIVNTTDAGKIIKIRFRDYANSEDVRDFNIYMSAKDVWTAAVLPVGASGMTGTGGFTGQGAGGAMVVTQDTTCTAPNKTAFQDVSSDFSTGSATLATYAVPFSKGDYQPNDDFTRGSQATQTLERVTRGYFEVIEQATIPTNTTMYRRIDHRVAGQGGRPNCAGLHSFPSSSAPLVNTTYAFPAYEGTTLTAPSGGLFGSAVWLNVANGTSNATAATAMNGFSRGQNVFNPGDQKPNFTDHVSSRTVVTMADKVVVVELAGSPTAVGQAGNVPFMWAATAPFFATNIYGEYAYSSDLALTTDWVVTMPGKRHFVTFSNGGALDAYAPTATSTVPPFANSSWWRTAASAGTARYTSPVEIAAVTYDREEASVTTPGCVFSPCDRLTVDTNSLPHESNVISFGPTSATSGSPSGAMGANNALWLLGVIQTPFVGGGWLDLSFVGTRPVVGSSIAGVFLTGGGATIGTGTNNVTFAGLPVIGFQATGAKSITGNFNSSYRHSSSLATRKSVTVINQQ